MQAKVQPSMRQTTNLSPKALASTVVLQMSSQELEQYVDKIRIENPVIDFEPPCAEADRELIKKLKWLSERRRRDAVWRDERYDDTDKVEPWAYVADKRAAFSDSLTMQLCGLRLDRNSERIARYIVQSLDDSGYFTDDVFEAAELLHTTAGDFLNVLGQLQARLEPAGLCAQSVEQCLVLQLERCGSDELAQEIAAEHLACVAKGDALGLAKKLNVSKARVQRCFDLIRNLDPKPGRTASPPESEPYVIPDVIVEVIDGAVNVSMFSTGPRISISEYYLEMLRMTQSKEVKAYLTDNIKQAKWLRYCIGQRDSTMLRVSKLIAERQKEFFVRGPLGLRPMTLSEAADELGLHKSTVCRAINGKFIACSWGCFEMSRFFPRSLGQSAAELTSGELEERIKSIVAGEDKLHPYSDREIAERLSESGAGVSRRTVAKYRAAAGVPDTSVRRRRE